MNLGKIEALTAYKNRIRILLSDLSQGLEKGLEKYLFACPYKTAPEGSLVFEASLPIAMQFANHLWPAHCAHILAVGTTKRGRAVKGSCHADVHSPGLVEVAKARAAKITGAKRTAMASAR